MLYETYYLNYFQLFELATKNIPKLWDCWNTMSKRNVNEKIHFSFEYTN